MYNFKKIFLNHLISLILGKVNATFCEKPHLSTKYSTMNQKLIFVFFYCFLLFFLLCENFFQSENKNVISDLMD